MSLIKYPEVKTYRDAGHPFQANRIAFDVCVLDTVSENVEIVASSVPINMTIGPDTTNAQVQAAIVAAAAALDPAHTFGPVN